MTTTATRPIFTAHGTEYTSLTQANLRIQELEAANNEPGVGPSDGRVTEILLIQAAIDNHYAEAAARHHAAAYPYYVLTRRYLKNGDCIKGRKEFRTRTAQCRYISTAPDSIAITAYN